ncbi:MAG: hypothetical protein HKL86_01185 [Acidimicrobiaceae bacterium]|nr:hypothetical protein [Acidimicrobiaceae bacterium]
MRTTTAGLVNEAPAPIDSTIDLPCRGDVRGANPRANAQGSMAISGERFDMRITSE